MAGTDAAAAAVNGQAAAAATAAAQDDAAAAAVAAVGDDAEAAITAAATAGLTPDGRAIYTRTAADAPHLLTATYKPLERERDAMFVTPAALSW